MVVAFASVVEYFVRVGRLASATVINNIAPDFQNPQPPDHGLVDGAIGELVKVVQVSVERYSSVASKFLGAGLGLRDNRNYRKGEAILFVDWC